MNHGTGLGLLSHHLSYVLIAGLLCVVGSLLTVVLMGQMRQSAPVRRQVQTLLVGLIAGTTIWATHFIAMLGYRPTAASNAYEPVLTGMSLMIVILGSYCAASFAQWRADPYGRAGSGFLLGITLSIMHYTGMAAVQAPGHMTFDPHLVILSICVACVLGWGVFVGINSPHQGRSRVTATAAMALAVCGMHFTGMASISFEADPSIIIPERSMTDAALGVMILGVVGVIFLVGVSTLLLDLQLKAETQRKLADMRLQDGLTGLPNRLALTEHLEGLQMRIDQGQDLQLAIVTVDLDKFKNINDLHGHIIGDSLLKAVADHLCVAMQKAEFVVRVGGDEFTAVKSNVRSDEDIVDFARRLEGAVMTPIKIGDRICSVGASFGIAVGPEEAGDMSTLLQHSGLAMDRAKTDDDRRIHYFDSEIDAENRARTALLQDLQMAMGKGELFLNYQLQNDLQTHDTIGFEVLLRWKHPIRGTVSPGQFIPLAEDTGLIKKIGFWVLQTACEEAVTWDIPMPIAVNVSPQQLVQPGFVSRVSHVLAETQLDPERLELEVTEASFIDNEKGALSVMHELKAMGIRVAMDDFGTGYSSLSMLRVFPFDKIKIDRSFIRDVHKSTQNAAIVRATLLLGVALNVPVLAEGTENEQELKFLLQEKCNAVQGFYFGQPMPVEKVRQLVMKGNNACGTTAAARLRA